MTWRDVKLDAAQTFKVLVGDWDADVSSEVCMGRGAQNAHQGAVCWPGAAADTPDEAGLTMQAQRLDMTQMRGSTQGDECLRATLASRAEQGTHAGCRAQPTLVPADGAPQPSGSTDWWWDAGASQLGGHAGQRAKMQSGEDTCEQTQAEAAQEAAPVRAASSWRQLARPQLLDVSPPASLLLSIAPNPLPPTAEHCSKTEGPTALRRGVAHGRETEATAAGPIQRPVHIPTPPETVVSTAPPLQPLLAPGVSFAALLPGAGVSAPQEDGDMCGLPQATGAALESAVTVPQPDLLDAMLHESGSDTDWGGGQCSATEARAPAAQQAGWLPMQVDLSASMARQATGAILGASQEQPEGCGSVADVREDSDVLTLASGSRHSSQRIGAWQPPTGLVPPSGFEQHTAVDACRQTHGEDQLHVEEEPFARAKTVGPPAGTLHEASRKASSSPTEPATPGEAIHTVRSGEATQSVDTIAASLRHLRCLREQLAQEMSSLRNRAGGTP